MEWIGRNVYVFVFFDIVRSFYFFDKKCTKYLLNRLISLNYFFKIIQYHIFWIWHCSRPKSIGWSLSHYNFSICQKKKKKNLLFQNSLKQHLLIFKLSSVQHCSKKIFSLVGTEWGGAIFRKLKSALFESLDLRCFNTNNWSLWELHKHLYNYLFIYLFILIFFFMLN